MSQSTGNSILQILMQLAAQTPLLLVYFAGIVLALVWYRRAPTAAALTLVAMTLFLGLAVGQPGLRLFIVQGHSRGGWEAQTVAKWLQGIGVLGSLLRALAFALLLAAVFSGRKQPADPNQAPAFTS